MNVKCDIKYLEHYDMEKWGPIKYAHEGDAAVDLRAAINEPITLYSMASYLENNIKDLLSIGMFNEKYNLHKIIPTGIKMSIPDGYYLQISPRSGLSAKNGITIINSPGIIDSKYIGEIQIILSNMSNTNFSIYPGDRIAQMTLKQYSHMEFNIVEELNETVRGTDGFGSTGIQ